jgi:CheY-like chemotaxis protein
MARLYSFRMTKRRVLVVDDDRTIADSSAARLRAEGIDVQIAGHLRQGHRHARAPTSFAPCRHRRVAVARHGQGALT